MLEIRISRTDTVHFGSPKKAELIVSGLEERQVWEVVFDEPIEITQVCEWSLPPEPIVIEKVPVYWKWFPWLPAFHEYLVRVGETVLIETISGWTGIQYRFRQSLMDRETHLKRGTRSLNSVGYEYRFVSGESEASLSNSDDLPIALALTSLWWFRDVTID